MADYQKGDYVQLRADASVIGVITQTLPGQPEDRYTVFHDGRLATYYASQLETSAGVEAAPPLVPFAEFNARLTALQINRPSRSTLYSLNGARINFVPYQFRPVLKFIRSDRPRLLVADEVGVGKTIEAGLILREMQARRDVRSVLIICPKPLVTERKWELELQRFDERFTHLDGPTLRHCISETDLNGVWPERHSTSILPFSLFDEQLLHGMTGQRRRKLPGLLDLKPPPRFDLVIVDEAHHLRNPRTYLHQGVRYFCDHAEAVVFLTATPIQIQSDDLFVLLNLLRPDVILDRRTFELMSGPNPFLNASVAAARAATPGWERGALEALILAGETPWGRTVLGQHPDYTTARQKLASGPLSASERVNLIRQVEELHTFSRLINRTRRRDIGAFTTRKAETVEVPFTETQQQLHDSLLAAQARILRFRHGDRGILFMMTALRRQAASCIYGLAPLIRGILARGIDELEWDEASEVCDAVEPVGEAARQSLDEGIRDVLGQAERLEGRDPKFEALLKVVRDKQRLLNNKILLFSSFRHTLRYLYERLACGEARVALIHGGTSDDERRRLRDRFSRPPEDPDAIDLLLSSEVGCEGLDYQFCDCLVNYDLPWNPMRVEQRIGRIDRYGQRSPVVAIYNFITPRTVDADIYWRCHFRIGVFREALGGSEEVLGRLSRELRTVAENLELTEAERESRLQQLADNEIRLIQEQAALEEREAELFGIVLPRQQLEQEVRDASSVWLSPEALQNLIAHYLAQRTGADARILDDRPLKSLRLSQEARNQILNDFQKLQRQPSQVYREWDRWLKGAHSRLDITFDGQTADDHRKRMLITLTHPLAIQAARGLGTGTTYGTACRARCSEVPPGEYAFAVYLWRRMGIHDDSALVPIAEGGLSDQLLALLERAECVAISPSAFPPQTRFDELENEHYRRWSDARTQHGENTTQLAQYRRESLRASHDARIAILQDQLSRADDNKIRRMRAAQIDAADADFTRRLEEIDAAERRSDILSEVVGLGLLVVEAVEGTGA